MSKSVLFLIFCVVLNSACFRANRNIEKVENTNVAINEVIPSPSVEPSPLPQGETMLTPAPDTLSVGLTLFRKGKETATESSEIFVKDDGVRLVVSTVETGFLYILYKASNGDIQVIFPSKEYFGGKNEVDVSKNVVIPKKGWLFFDEKKGVETVYVVFSKTQNLNKFAANPKQTLSDFEKLRAEKNNEHSFNDKDGDLIRVIELNHR
jgi:hypothetical protein